MSHIVTVPNAVLRQVSKPVEKLDKKILSVISDMTKTLVAAKKPQGVGLAAPQIGINLRIFLTRPTPKSEIKVFINPEIINFSQRRQTSQDAEGVLEGCLSIPAHYAPVTRSMSVTVKYKSINQTIPNTTNPDLALDIDRLMIEKTEVFSDFPAHVVQHEMDHLNGILFIDRVLEQNSKLYKVVGKDWEEISF